MVSTEQTNIDKLRALCLRWNKAAASVGICGSEHIDDPEHTFEAVNATRSTLMRQLVKAKQETTRLQTLLATSERNPDTPEYQQSKP